jgi:phage portal protein BeeE
VTSLLEKMAARRQSQEKAWSEPPFWITDTPGWTGSGEEKLGTDYMSMIEQAYKASSPVFAVLRFRQLIFSEARFQWRQRRGGQPGDLFGTPELGLLEQPWPGGTTGDLLARMELTSSLAGNYYGTIADDEGQLGRNARGNRRIVHMRPDRVTIVVDSASGDPNALDARVVGFVYVPPPTGVREPEPVTLLPSEVVHYAPMPDPAARFRGMSWLTPVVEEIRADKAATKHKGKFFTNGATPGMAIILGDTVSPEQFDTYVAKFKAAHQGADKAYKPLFLAGGADVRPLSADFRQMDFKALQGLSETRIAMAAGVHPTVVGMSEGLQGSSLNSGNFNAAARLVANTTMRPLWRNVCSSLQTLVTAPAGAELWYDDRDIAFLREDGTDLATIRTSNAAALRSLVDGGFDPDAAVEYVQTNDLNRLKGKHSGLVPVQLRPPGVEEDRPGASSNGRINGSQVPVPR